MDELAAEVDLASLLRQTPCTLAGEAAGCADLTLRLAYLLFCGVGREQTQAEVGRRFGNASRGKPQRHSAWLAQGTQSWSWECSAACTSASASTQSLDCGLWQTSRTWACRTAGQARPSAHVGLLLSCFLSGYAGRLNACHVQGPGCQRFADEAGRKPDAAQRCAG